jgi:hypothetical protein
MMGIVVPASRYSELVQPVLIRCCKLYVSTEVIQGIFKHKITDFSHVDDSNDRESGRDIDAYG